MTCALHGSMAHYLCVYFFKYGNYLLIQNCLVPKKYDADPAL
jgi:hypothetical protein